MATSLYPVTTLQQVTTLLNTPLQLANALRYVDANNNPVYQLYLGDYVSLIGSTVGIQIGEIQQINTILGNYQTTLTSLQAQITAIQTSGATAIPQVNAGCLSSPANQVLPINVVTANLVSNSCAYNTALGTPTALAAAIAIENAPTLNTLPAFSQNSAMAGLTGWSSLPLYISDAINNLWLSYLDSRAGVTKALAAVTPTCAQVIVNYQATLPAFSTGFNIYFDGYTFIPTGYTDAGSTIVIKDAAGNTATNGINIITQSTTNQPYNFVTSGTTLVSNSTYTIYVNSNVTNTALGITCQKTIVQNVTAIKNAGAHSIGTYTAVVTSGTTSIPIITGLSYLPVFVSVSSLSSASSAILSNGYTNLNATTPPYWQYVEGGANYIIPGGLGTTLGGILNVNWIAY